jgi:hypothetical protein
MGNVDLVNVGEREKIIVDALGDDEGSTSFCWRIGDEARKDYHQVVYRQGGMNLNVCSEV